VLRTLARWNECLLDKSCLLFLRIKPDTIGSPWLVHKMTQDQSTASEAAQEVLEYRPRPLRETLRRNCEWLVGAGILPQTDSTPLVPEKQD
jgi:hypothetical protein